MNDVADKAAYLRRILSIFGATPNPVRFDELPLAKQTLVLARLNYCLIKNWTRPRDFADGVRDALVIQRLCAYVGGVTSQEIGHGWLVNECPAYAAHLARIEAARTVTA